MGRGVCVWGGGGGVGLGCDQVGGAGSRLCIRYAIRWVGRTC